MQNMPPISHYKDEPVNQDAATQSIIENEIDKEVSKSLEQTPKLKVLPVETPAKKPSNPSNIVNIFKQKMSMNTTTVELPTIGRSVDFKDINAESQKILSQSAFEHNSRADIMYVSMLNLINNISVDKTFNIRDYTEFERISITLSLQQMNKTNTEVKYTCQSCGKENSYRLDTLKMIRGFNKSYRPDKEIEMDAGNRRFRLLVGWPKVSQVEEFFKSYYRKYDNVGRSAQDRIDKFAQIEYISMFIKSITMTENSDPDDSITANLEELTYGERVQIIDSVPQFIIFDDNDGIISKIIESFVNPMNDSFKYSPCAFCGAEQDGTMASLSDFMG